MHWKQTILLSGDAHARRPLHKMDGVFFKRRGRMRVDRFIKWTVFFLSGDAHARRPLHKMDGVFFLSGDAHARRPLHKMDGVFFFSFCRSVVGTSGLAPSATSGPLILQVPRKMSVLCSLISPNLNLQDHFLASI